MRKKREDKLFDPCPNCSHRQFACVGKVDDDCVRIQCVKCFAKNIAMKLDWEAAPKWGREIKPEKVIFT